MRTLSKGSAVLLGALLLSGCNQSPGGASAAAASTQPRASQENWQLAEGQNSGMWDLVAQAPDGSRAYDAPSSYRIIDDHRVAIAEKLTGKASSPDPATIYINEYDCAQHTQTTIAYSRLDSAGKTVGGYKYKPGESPPTNLSPGMIGWVVSQSICKALGMGG
jgi:hypothetical protein